MTELEAIHVISQAIGWIGLLALSPFLYRFSYAFAFYLTGRLVKRHKILVQYKEDGEVVREVTVRLDSRSPIVKQLETAGKANR